MDSIFQIKINENKLQKILNDLAQEQLRQAQELQAIRQDLHSHNSDVYNIVNSVKLQMLTKVDALHLQTAQHYQTFHLQSSQNTEQLKRDISELRERLLVLDINTTGKQQQLERDLAALQAQMSTVDRQMGCVLAKADQKIQQVMKKLEQVVHKSIDDELLQKIENLEKMRTASTEVPAILKNKLFIHFIDYLADKESKATESRERHRVSPNPFASDISEERSRAFQELKRSLGHVQNRVDFIQTEFAGLLHSATEGRKQTKQEGHLNYAILSAKIKQLELKIEEHAINASYQNNDRIMYPNESRDFVKAKSIKPRPGQPEENPNPIEGIMAKISEQFSQTAQQSNQVKAKLEEVEREQGKKLEKLDDKTWSNSQKIEFVKASYSALKAEVDKMAEKLKLALHYSQYQKDPLINSKTMGEFLLQFRTIQDNIDDKMRQLVELRLYNKNTQQTNERIKIINEQMQTKASKDETRKAFGFLEEKIKEIVTILADMQNTSRKTAARRMVVQCLSCDENFFDDGTPTHNEAEHSATTSREMTARTPSTFNVRSNRGPRVHLPRKPNLPS